MNRTSLLFWFPLIRDLGVPVPRTEWALIDPPTDAESLMYPESGVDENAPPLLFDWAGQIEAAVDRLGSGYPIFMRTDLMSGKHLYWDTCYVGSASDLMAHALALMEDQAVHIMFPRSDENVSAVVVRELLPLAAEFAAFRGLPIAPERRYFVGDGRVTCHHPYWIDADNIKNGLEWGTAVPDWEALLASVNEESPDEIALLTDYATRVAQALSGAWSVDFAKTVDGAWHLIDMAEAGVSWHPEHGDVV